MENLIVVERKDLKVVKYAGDSFGKGTYLIIRKCKGGIMVSRKIEANSPIRAFRYESAKSIMSLEILVDGSPITLYARNGKKVWACEQILSEMEVGDINQDLLNTALYDPNQYKAVNAKTWKSKAFVMNEAVA